MFRDDNLVRVSNGGIRGTLLRDEERATIQTMLMTRSDKIMISRNKEGMFF